MKGIIVKGIIVKGIIVKGITEPEGIIHTLFFQVFLNQFISLTRNGYC